MTVYNCYTIEVERFEYNPDKSKTNRDRHGIDFITAQKLWETTHVIIPAKNVKGENRYVIIGKIQNRLFAAIYTKRGESIRLISCHRADRKWEKIYEEITQEKTDN